jgi:glycosyltransferase involved in cell wall biosynthesis
MKIAIDVRKWRDFGIGTYVRNLVRHLARLDHDATYLLFCNEADEATLRDLAENFVPVVDRSPGYGLREHLAIPLKLRRLGAELLHTPHYVRPLLCTIPSVVTIHDCIHLLFPQYLPNRMAWRYARFIMGSAVRHSALVFTVSEASRADILRFYPWADPDKVHVVPNAIDTELLDNPGEEEMERVSRYGALRRAVEQTGLRQDVRFFGFVPHRTLAALYRMAALFAFPSLYEGFGLPPLEAMSCGTPVVTSRISSLPEVVDDAALLVDPYSVEDIALAMGRLLDDDALRTRLVEKGLARAQSYSWERSVRAIHAGYMKAMGRPAPALAEATH